MAKIHIRRVAERLGLSPDELSGANYRRMMTDMINLNYQNVSRAVGRLTNRSYQDQIDRLAKRGRGKAKTVVLPQLDEIVPKRSVSVRKAADQGREITQTLSDRLTKNLRDTLRGFQEKGQAFEMGRGRGAGKINPQLVQEFQKTISQTFQNYTRRHPDFGGVPKNVRNIAVTEVRATIDSIKQEYNQNLLNKNRDKIRMQKTWIQNRSLAHNPRPEHTEMHRVTIDFEQPFRVPSPNGGYDLMMHPHDPTAPPEQVITCNCDMVVKAVLI